MPNFVATQNYWNGRYQSGRTSGSGSIDEYRRWKWAIIERYAPKAVSDIVDVGCGDRSFWTERAPGRYTGIDFSEIIIRKNREQWPDLNLICARGEDYQPGVSAATVICMDVLFHVMDEEAYERILRNITRYSTDWIFIYTWTGNPFLSWTARWQFLKARKFAVLWRSLLGRAVDDGEYQKYREFSSYFPIFVSAGFELQAIEKNPIRDSFGGFFIFRRK